ncbi:prolyl endopeptidase-like isoform X2 [Dunckerocampus dactyliophorus]|uniref:prolyl endopeptidase-like isoform X2 n=1 Tax=Dunckerocampus dactyliophorus TaxID=161453 RepID=UPI002406654C|nr:prolyl endopeptidase-like isoform X2 [Dunckerocampus dactyliophorus]
MAVLAVPRFITFRSHFSKRCYFPWMQRVTPSVRRHHSTYTSVDHLNPGLERYKDLQAYFKRHLKATYSRFSNTLDYSEVYGRHHVYFIEGNSIYRMDKTQCESQPEKVFHLGQIPAREEEEEETGPEAWTLQRIRLSPLERHLAATVKTHYKEALRCVVVKLGQRSFSVVLTLDDVFSFEWATDEVLFYTVQEGLQCHRVYRLDLTPRGSTIRSVYEESQPDVFVEVALSRDRQLLTINSNNRTSSEVLLVDVSAPGLEPVMFQPRQTELLYHVEHWKRNLIILANTGPGQEYQAPLSEPSMWSWESVFTPRAGTVLKDMDVVEDHCVLVAQTSANELELIVIPLTQPRQAYTLQLPSWACTVESKRPGLADQGVFEFFISSPAHPPVSYCLYPEEGLLLSGTDDASAPKNQESPVTTTRLKACSQDGTLVPLTLLHGVKCSKQTPLLVHVYGAYGRDVNMDFCPEKRLLLEKGWALAYCHIRGGGERGLAWQRQARVEGKLKGIEDLQACLHHLFSSGVSSPSLTALAACSAGAVPVGALCNSRPDMMQAAVLQSPFLDVLQTMDDAELPLTVEDREEWGDPIGNPKHRLAIASYCPVHNITPQRYPSMLLTAYSGDSRAPLAGVLKYSEKLKEAVQAHFSMAAKLEPEPNIVVNIKHGENHLEADDWEMTLEEEALKLAFLYKELGLDPPRSSRRRRKR